MSAKGKSREITVQRDILGLLAAKSQQQNAAINIDKALCYQLAPAPLSLETCDGLRRKTAKRKLLNAALTSLIKNDAQFPEVQQSCRIYILDLAAIIRSMIKIPNTFKDLALLLLSDVPRQYNVVYVACDTYKIRSIKNSEQSLAVIVTNLSLEVKMYVYLLILRSLEITKSDCSSLSRMCGLIIRIKWENVLYTLPGGTPASR